MFSIGASLVIPNVARKLARLDDKSSDRFVNDKSSDRLVEDKSSDSLDDKSSVKEAVWSDDFLLSLISMEGSSLHPNDEKTLRFELSMARHAGKTLPKPFASLFFWASALTVS
jgi:hypothetical protein